MSKVKRSRFDFGEMIVKVILDLDDTRFEEFRNHVTSGIDSLKNYHPENIHSKAQLFKIMYESELISVTDVEVLLYILNQMGLRTCAAIVERYRYQQKGSITQPESPGDDSGTGMHCVDTLPDVL